MPDRLLAQKGALSRKQDLDARELRLRQEREWILLETELEAQNAELAVYNEYEDYKNEGVVSSQTTDESVRDWLRKHSPLNPPQLTPHPLTTDSTVNSSDIVANRNGNAANHRANPTVRIDIVNRDVSNATKLCCNSANFKG